MQSVCTVWNAGSKIGHFLLTDPACIIFTQFNHLYLCRASLLACSRTRVPSFCFFGHLHCYFTHLDYVVILPLRSSVTCSILLLQQLLYSQWTINQMCRLCGNGHFLFSLLRPFAAMLFPTPPASLTPLSYPVNEVMMMDAWLMSVHLVPPLSQLGRARVYQGVKAWLLEPVHPCGELFEWTEDEQNTLRVTRGLWCRKSRRIVSGLKKSDRGSPVMSILGYMFKRRVVASQPALL